jgi:hypothetical protein
VIHNYSESRLKQTLNKLKSCINRTLNKVLIQEIFVNLTCVNQTPVYSEDKSWSLYNYLLVPDWCRAKVRNSNSSMRMWLRIHIKTIWTALVSPFFNGVWMLFFFLHFDIARYIHVCIMSVKMNLFALAAKHNKKAYFSACF